jgi:phage tail sheath gpL-like
MRSALRHSQRKTQNEVATMDLKEFVAESLKEVISGVKDAQIHAHENGAEICPTLQRRGESKAAYYVSCRSNEKVVFVNFDIALSAEDTTKGDAGGKLSIKIASLSAGVEKAETNSSISRLQFELPVVWPIHHKHKDSKS